MELQPTQLFYSSEQARWTVEAIESYLQNRSFDNIGRQNLKHVGSDLLLVMTGRVLMIFTSRATEKFSVIFTT